MSRDASLSDLPACDYDVAVVGAGPGGGGAARELAARGIRTALLEKEQVPRYKRPWSRPRIAVKGGG